MQKWPPDKTRLERNGWRDESISLRHRNWGFDCPCTDIDFLLIEYHLAEPIALVEYKHHQADFPNLKQAGYRALQRLAEKACLPLLLTFYWPDIWAFQVFPINILAKIFFKQGECLTEFEYVARLHRMRRVALNQEMVKRLFTIKPPNNELKE
jgi:hypothetical protein